MYTHTPCFHVIAGNVGRKAYVNMFKKIFLEHEILLGSTGLFGNSFQKQPLEKSISQIKVILSKLILP